MPRDQWAGPILRRWAGGRASFLWSIGVQGPDKTYVGSIEKDMIIIF